jgi:hypothetical protein
MFFRLNAGVRLATAPPRGNANDTQSTYQSRST